MILQQMTSWFFENTPWYSLSFKHSYSLIDFCQVSLLEKNGDNSLHPIKVIIWHDVTTLYPLLLYHLLCKSNVYLPNQKQFHPSFPNIFISTNKTFLDQPWSQWLQWFSSHQCHGRYNVCDQVGQQKRMRCERYLRLCGLTTIHRVWEDGWAK